MRHITCRPFSHELTGAEFLALKILVVTDHWLSTGISSFTTPVWSSIREMRREM
jgi:hypothetical protein